MSKKVKIYGAGSIGNHLTNACRVIGWNVTVCDKDPSALKRMKESIYPGRYGAWDDNISLHEAGNEPKGGYDLIIIGTPPDTHIELARNAVREHPVAILIEKPFCTPDLNGASQLIDEANDAGVELFCGYDHAVSLSAGAAMSYLSDNKFGAPLTVDVEFREHWGGIFAAHPWLAGPQDSYLGYWKRGGGACGEHSHAINLWQQLAKASGAGRVTEVTANLRYFTDGQLDFDQLCLANFKTDGGLEGRVVQDVITRPPKKWARVQSSAGSIDWYCGVPSGHDSVVLHDDNGKVSEERFPKTRPDDFIQELQHISGSLESSTCKMSPISAEFGLDTMLVIAACHKSSQLGRKIYIDYSKGYNANALNLG